MAGTEDDTGQRSTGAGHREHEGSRSSWFGWGRPPVGALVLLGLGLLLLLSQFGLAFTGRWWTVFVLVPAAGLLVASVRLYRDAAGWTPKAIGALVAGLVLMAVWARLFFGFAFWHFGWMGWHAGPLHGHLLPLILVVVGAVLLMRRARWQR